jgi:hypothetical protein
MLKLFFLLLLGVVAWIAVPSSAEAGEAKEKATDATAVIAGADASSELAAAPKAEDKVKVPKDKPKRSKKNPNDDKDEDPDDGNAGGGNDDKKLPNDGPAND